MNWWQADPLASSCTRRSSDHPGTNMTTAAPTSPQPNGKGVVPLTAHRRLHCLLESTKAEVQEEKALRERHNFINSSPVTMKQQIGDPDNVAENLSRLHPGLYAGGAQHLRSDEYHLYLISSIR